jgi:hypothetical protein
MYDIFYITNRDEEFFKKFKAKYPAAKRASRLSDAKRKCFTKFFWAVFDNLETCEDFDFSYEPDEWSQDVVHVFRNGDHYDGVCLIPKNNLPTEKELEYRFFTQKKEVNIQASSPKAFDRFYIDTYEEYLDALENTTTEFFWVIPSDVEINSDFDFSYQAATWEKYPHLFLNGEFYDGVSLHNTHSPTTKKELEDRFFTRKKEVDIQASTPKPYDVFEIETYNDYEYALENSFTEMFWMSSPNIKVNQELVDTFYFSHHNTQDRSQNHAFIHEVDGEKYYNGLFLCSKQQPLTKREVEYRFPVNRREWDLTGSTSITYEIFQL